MTTKGKDFEITSAATDEVGDKMDIVWMEDLLNEKLHLQDYGKGISKIFFVFIAVPTDNTIHENEVFFDKENRTLEASLKLDYNLILQGSSTTNLELMYELFKALFEIDTVPSIADFDHDSFRKDLKDVFRMSGTKED